MYKIVLLFTVLFSQIIYSQSGIISGKVIDESINDVLPFASVIAKNTTSGNSTDFDGKYSFEIEPGTYTLVVSFIGYTTAEISDVVVQDGEETIVDAFLKPSSSSLKEVVITTTTRKNTEKAIVKLQKNSATVIDAISAQTIKKSGASNVAAAVKQVPGVAIQDGKFVVVRGLSDRYSKTTLNGLDIPGLDPDKNALQVDLFPTNILENLVVNKTASADLPADFTGGIVDITLKDFSNKPEYSVSASLGYNPSQHFQSDFQRVDNGDLGFLGFSDNRNLVLSRESVTVIPLDDRRIDIANLVTSTFEPELRAPRETNFVNYNFGFTASNSYDIGNDKIGYQASVSYKNETQFFEDDITGSFQIDNTSADDGVFSIVARNISNGTTSIQETLLTGLAGLSYKGNNTKLKLTGLFIRNGVSTASLNFQDISEVGGGGFSRIVDENTFTEKTIANFLLAGEHKLNDWKIEWKFSPTFSSVDDLDHRVTPLRIGDDVSTANLLEVDTASGSPFRIWRFLEEENYTSKIDFIKRYDFNNDINGKVKFGGYSTIKERDFAVGSFRFGGGPSLDLTVNEGNPNDLFLQENIISTTNTEGFGIAGSQTFNDSDIFNAQQTTAAVYVSNETKFSEKFRATIGLRFENFVSEFSGFDGENNFIDNEKIVNEADLFPSANLVYSFNDQTNLRFSYSRSTARPSFREASSNDIFDPVTDRRFIGALAFGIRLKPTYINNFDTRIEFFGEDGDGFALSGFYKDFTDAIELTFPVTPSTISPRNFDSAFLFGAELEIKKNLDFTGVNNFYAKVNVTLVESEVDIDSSQIITGSDEDTRSLQGQAPYTINAALEYNNSGYIASLNYNVQGETLEVVGVNIVPNVFSQPFSDLTFNGSKTFNNHKVSFKATNILGDVKEQLFVTDNIGLQDEIFSRRRPNRTFTLGYTYNF